MQRRLIRDEYLGFFSTNASFALLAIEIVRCPLSVSVAEFARIQICSLSHLGISCEFRYRPARLALRGAFATLHFRCLEGHAHSAQQLARFLVALPGDHDRNVHALGAGVFVGIQLGKHQLF